MYLGKRRNNGGFDINLVSFVYVDGDYLCLFIMLLMHFHEFISLSVIEWYDKEESRTDWMLSNERASND